jgi:hypothetical protein
MTNILAAQAAALVPVKPPVTHYLYVPQVALLAPVNPGQARYTFGSQADELIARKGVTVIEVSQTASLIAYKTKQPINPRQIAWTFVLDGHRFYVLDLGPEGTWAYDTTTQEWCQYQTQGFTGMNFTHGTMWGTRIMGGDSLYPNVLELDPNQSLDEGWREVEHMVTGGVASRSRARIGVANFTLTASVGDDSATDQPITLAFSDDNGVTWSQEFSQMLTDVSTQMLIWNSLGSFAAPGRVFRITDYSGPIRLDGADVVLTIGTGADSGIEQDGQKTP